MPWRLGRVVGQWDVTDAAMSGELRSGIANGSRQNGLPCLDLEWGPQTERDS